MRTLEEHISGLNKRVQTVLPANFEEYSSGLKEHLVTFQEYDMSPSPVSDTVLTVAAVESLQKCTENSR